MQIECKVNGVKPTECAAVHCRTDNNKIKNKIS